MNSTASHKLALPKHYFLPDLPEPDAAALQHSVKLIEKLRGLIEQQGGMITFEQFMAEVLYAPGLGYYSAGSKKFGEAGDFVTAPEISPLFSRCLARQCQQLLSTIAGGEIIEVGAGSGLMAAELLLELQARGCLPGHYYILELSADLRERQQKTIAEKIPDYFSQVVWLDQLPQSGFKGVVLANELLDAMPVHRFRIEEQGISELCVSWGADGFFWSTRPMTNQPLLSRIAELGELPVGYESEINLAADSWVASFAEILEQGAVLLIDYGFPRHEFYHEQRNGGTLMCHYRHHAHPDPFTYIGLQDLTAHVDFTAIAEAAVNAGLDVEGYTSQGYFLLSLDMEEMAAEIDHAETVKYLNQAQQIKKLTMPGEMGELFKVIALGKGLEESPQGFQFMDQRRKL